MIPGVHKAEHISGDLVGGGADGLQILPNRFRFHGGILLRKLLDGKGKTIYKDFGELLFTHFGVSGPTVLSASAHMKEQTGTLSIDLKPALESRKLEDRILRDLELYRNRSMENALTDLLPRSMIPVVLRRLDIDPRIEEFDNCFTISDKARCIAGGVLEAILYLRSRL